MLPVHIIYNCRRNEELIQIVVNDKVTVILYTLTMLLNLYLNMSNQVHLDSRGLLSGTSRMNVIPISYGTSVVTYTFTLRHVLLKLYMKCKWKINA